MIKQKMLVIACAAGLALPMASAHADVDKRARNMAASCGACHGTNGHSSGGIVNLAGMPKEAFVASLKAFKAGTRPSTVMHRHAKGYSDQEYEMMANFFAEQK